MTPGPAAADSRCAGGALPPSGRVPLRHLKASEGRPGPKLTPARAGKARGQPADGATPDASQDRRPGLAQPRAAADRAAAETALPCPQAARGTKDETALHGSRGPRRLPQPYARWPPRSARQFPLYARQPGHTPALLAAIKKFCQPEPASLAATTGRPAARR